MTISIEDLQYVDAPNKTLQEARDEIIQEIEDGELTPEEAQDKYEQFDKVESQLDEAGRPEWADDADDPENFATKLPNWEAPDRGSFSKGR